MHKITVQEYIRKYDFFHHSRLAIIPMIVRWNGFTKYWHLVWANGNREERDAIFEKFSRGEMNYREFLEKGEYLKTRYVFFQVKLEAPNPITDVQVFYEIDSIRDNDEQIQEIQET